MTNASEDIITGEDTFDGATFSTIFNSTLSNILPELCALIHNNYVENAFQREFERDPLTNKMVPVADSYKPTGHDIVFLRETLLGVLATFCRLQDKSKIFEIPQEELMSCFKECLTNDNRCIFAGSTHAMMGSIAFNVQKFKKLAANIIETSTLDKAIMLFKKNTDDYIDIPLIVRKTNPEALLPLSEFGKWSSYLIALMVNDFNTHNKNSKTKLLMDVVNLPVCAIKNPLLPWDSDVHAAYVLPKTSLTQILSRTASDSKLRLSSWKHVVNLMTQVVSIIDVLHRNGIAARNICLDKFIVQWTDEVVIDNVLTFFSEHDPVVKECGHDLIGYSGSRVCYAAPECHYPENFRPLLIKFGEISKLDIYSIGIILLEICFQQNTLDQKNFKNKAGKYVYPSYSMIAGNLIVHINALKEVIPDNLYKIITRCVHMKPEVRPSASELSAVITSLPEENLEYVEKNIPIIEMSFEEDFKLPSQLTEDFQYDDKQVDKLNEIASDFISCAGRDNAGTMIGTPFKSLN